MRAHSPDGWCAMQARWMKSPACFTTTLCPTAGRPHSSRDVGSRDSRCSATRPAESYRVCSRPTIAELTSPATPAGRRVREGPARLLTGSPCRTMALYCTSSLEKPNILQRDERRAQSRPLPPSRKFERAGPSADQPWRMLASLLTCLRAAGTCCTRKHVRWASDERPPSCSSWTF